MDQLTKLLGLGQDSLLEQLAQPAAHNVGINSGRLQVPLLPPPPPAGMLLSQESAQPASLSALVTPRTLLPCRALSQTPIGSPPISCRLHHRLICTARNQETLAGVQDQSRRPVIAALVATREQSQMPGSGEWRSIETQHGAHVSARLKNWRPSGACCAYEREMLRFKLPFLSAIHVYHN